MQKKNIKEIYVECLVLFVGIVYLLAQIDSLFSIGSTTVTGDTVQISKNEILSHVRSIITIFFCFAGGILLIKHRRTGWILSQAILLLLLTILSGIFFSNISFLNISAIILVIGMFLLLLAIYFLVGKDTRQKFSITWKSYLLVLLLFASLAAFYFLLQ